MHTFPVIINNDLDKHIQAKTSDKRVRHLGAIVKGKKWELYIAKKKKK